MKLLYDVYAYIKYICIDFPQNCFVSVQNLQNYHNYLRNEKHIFSTTHQSKAREIAQMLTIYLGWYLLFIMKADTVALSVETHTHTHTNIDQDYCNLAAAKVQRIVNECKSQMI